MANSLKEPIVWVPPYVWAPSGVGLALGIKQPSLEAVMHARIRQAEAKTRATD